MASSTFSDIPATLTDRGSLNNTLIIIVNNDGTLSVDQETLHGLLAEQETSSTTAVRLIRLGVSPDDGCQDSSDSEESNSSHVNITVEGYYPPSMSQGYQHTNDDIVDPFLGMDPEEMERLESALQSDEAKQILGEDVAAMLDILTVDDGTMSASHVNDSIKMDHCYTNRLPVSSTPSVVSTTSSVSNAEPLSKGPGRPRKDYSVRNPRAGMSASNSNLVMVKHIKTINPPLQQLQSPVVKKLAAAKSSQVTNDGASGSVLKRNIPFSRVNTTPISITEEMLNEKLQEIQRSADEYTNLSGDEQEERSNSSIDQSIDVEEVLQSTQTQNVVNTLKRTGGKSSTPRRAEIKNAENTQIQQPTYVKQLQTKLKLDTPKKVQSNQSILELNNSMPSASDHVTTSEATPSQIMKKNYPKRENRKLPARLTEVFGPALFSTLDVPRRVSLDSKTAEFQRQTEKLHVEQGSSIDSAYYGDSAHTFDGERTLSTNSSVGAVVKSAERLRHSSTEGDGHLTGRRRSDEKPASLRGRSPRQSLDNSDATDADSELMMGENTEDDPHKLWCICKRPHNNRFMICCDACEEWFHGKCVGVTKALGKTMEEEGNEWTCPNCKKKGKDNSTKNPLKKQMKMTTFLSNVTKQSPADTRDLSHPSEKQDTAVAASNVTGCIVCKKQARANSIYCSDACILKHAKDSKPTSIPEKSVPKTTTATKKQIPTVSSQNATQSGSLKAWLQANPTIKVIKTSLPTATSQGTVVVVKSPQIPVTKLKQAQLIAPKPMSPVVLKTSAKSGTDVGQKVMIAKSVSSGASTSHVVLSSEKMLTGAKPTSNSLLKEKTLASKVESKRQSLIDVPKKEEKKSATEPIRLNVRNTLHELLLARIQECEDLKSIVDDKVKKMGLYIEEELYSLFRDVGAKYKSKYRSLVFNIKDPKNFTLFRKIAEKSITPYQLVRLTAEEMASQEMAEWRERESQHELELIKKNELDLMAQSKTYVMKTHKGEQVIESEDGVKNDGPQLENLDSLVVVSNSVTSTVSDIDGQDKSRTSEKVRSKRSDSKSSKSRKNKKDKKDRRKDGKSHSRSSHSKDKHHSKSHSERKKVATTTHEVKDLDKSNEHERNKTSKADCPVMDEISIKEVILGKLEEDDSNADLEPTSTVNIKTPEINYSEDTLTESDDTVVWRGVAEMPEVAKFRTTIHMVSGESEHHCQSLSNKLDIVGRITPKLVWDHVSKMRKSDSYDIMVIRLEASSEAERVPYATLYSYLNSRSRLGVVGVKGIVGPVSPLIKDFYIMPLSKHSPLPQEILPLSGPGLVEDRQHLLLGILVARSSKKRMAGAPISVGPSAAKVFRSTDALDVSSAAARSYTPPLPEETELAVTPDNSMYTTSQKGSVEVDEKRPHLEELAAIKLRVSHLLNEDCDAPYSPGDEGPTAEDFLAEPTNADDMQRKMEELNRKIAEEKQEIENISSSFTEDAGANDVNSLVPKFIRDRTISASDDNEAYSPSESITPPLQSNIPFLSSIETSGSSSFIPNVSQDIALPSNLQEILASIKKQSDTKLDLKLDPIVQSYATRMDEKSKNLPHTEEADAYIPSTIKSSKELSSSILPAMKSPTKQLKVSSTPSTLSKLSDKELIEKAAAMERELELESSPIPVDTFINKAPPIPSIKVPPVKYSSASSSVLTIDTDGLLNLPIHPSKVFQPKPPGVDDFTSYPLPPPVPNYPPPRYSIPPPGMYPPPPPPPLPPPDYPAPSFPMANSNYNAYPGHASGFEPEGNKRKHTGKDVSSQSNFSNSGKKSNQHWGSQ